MSFIVGGTGGKTTLIKYAAIARYTESGKGFGVVTPQRAICPGVVNAYRRIVQMMYCFNPD